MENRHSVPTSVSETILAVAHFVGQLLTMALNTPILFLATNNATRAIAFYRDVLGLPLVSSDDYALVFRVGVLQLRIQKVEQVFVAPYAALGWKVADVKGEMKRLHARGVRFERFEGLDQKPDGLWQSPSGAVIAWFKDPDGHVLSLSQMDAAQNPS